MSENLEQVEKSLELLDEIDTDELSEEAQFLYSEARESLFHLSAALGG